MAQPLQMVNPNVQAQQAPIPHPLPSGLTLWKGLVLGPGETPPPVSHYAFAQKQLAFAWEGIRQGEKSPLKKNYFALAECLVEIEKTASTDPSKSFILDFWAKDPPSYLKDSTMLLASIHPDVMEHLIQGTLAQVYIKDPQRMKRLIFKYEGRYPDSIRDPLPSVYLNILARENGDPISVQDREQMCRIMLGYVNRNPSAAEVEASNLVDQVWRGASTSNRSGRQLFDSSVRYGRCKHSVESFVRNHRRRIHQDRAASIITEVGLSASCVSSRQATHRNMGDGSPHTLRLAYAALGSITLAQRQERSRQVAAGVTNPLVEVRRFHMHQFTVLYTVDPHSLSLGENLLTTLVGAYETHGGCNQAGAGENNNMDNRQDWDSNRYAYAQDTFVTLGIDQQIIDNIESTHTNPMKQYVQEMEAYAAEAKAHIELAEEVSKAEERLEESVDQLVESTGRLERRIQDWHTIQEEVRVRAQELEAEVARVEESNAEVAALQAVADALADYTASMS